MAQPIANPNRGRLIIRWLKEFQPDRLLPSLTMGLGAWIITVIIEISFAVLIFSGDLAGYVAQGIGVTLFGATVIAAVVALSSSYAGTIAMPQGSSSVILALLAAAIANGMAATKPPEEIFLTVVAAIALTSVLTGLLFLALGWSKSGRFIRFIPYPVVGGFLAGSGWLLVRGAVTVMADIPFAAFRLPTLLQVDTMLRWLPGFIFALLLLIILRRFNHFLVMPGLMLAATAVFYLIAWLTSSSLAELQDQGWLLGPFSGGELWQPLFLNDLLRVDWWVVLNEITNITTVLIVSAVSLLLIASEIELTIERDIDLDQELRAAGLANLAAGLGSGIVGYHSLNLSVLGRKMNTNSRLTGLFTAALCGLTLFFGGPVLAWFPRPVLGGLLIYLGLTILIEWVFEAWTKLPKPDYFIVILILVAVGVLGFLQGVSTGILVALIMFVFNYSRVEAVKHALSGAEYQSNFEHSYYHQELLQEEKSKIYILFLQGYIFFGTANTLLGRIRQRITDPALPLVRFLVLDFALVNGLDSSALLSFRKMKWLAQTYNLTLVFTDLPPRFKSQLEEAGCLLDSDPLNIAFPDLDYGLEWCENELLSGKDQVRVQPPSFQEQFTDLFPVLDDVSRLIKYFEPLETSAGYYLFRQGDSSDGLYFVEFGQVTVLLQGPDGHTVRLRTMGSGTIIGEMGLYTGEPRTASVVTDWPSRLYRLSDLALLKMDREEPELAVMVHQFMGRLMARRLEHANNTVDILLGQREIETSGQPAHSDSTM